MKTVAGNIIHSSSHQSVAAAVVEFVEPGGAVVLPLRERELSDDCGQINLLGPSIKKFDDLSGLHLALGRAINNDAVSAGISDDAGAGSAAASEDGEEEWRDEAEEEY